MVANQITFGGTFPHPHHPPNPPPPPIVWGGLYLAGSTFPVCRPCWRRCPPIWMVPSHYDFDLNLVDDYSGTKAWRGGLLWSAPLIQRRDGQGRTLRRKCQGNPSRTSKALATGVLLVKQMSLWCLRRRDPSGRGSKPKSVSPQTSDSIQPLR